MHKKVKRLQYKSEKMQKTKVPAYCNLVYLQIFYQICEEIYTAFCGLRGAVINLINRLINLRQWQLGLQTKPENDQIFDYYTTVAHFSFYSRGLPVAGSKSHASIFHKNLKSRFATNNRFCLYSYYYFKHKEMLNHQIGHF